MGMKQKMIGLGLVALWALLPMQARACRYEALPLKDNVAKAEKVFVGTVATVENGLVIIKVENGLKNAAAGEEVTTDLLKDQSSCTIRFQPGQRWLYLGPYQPSGSLLLQDEYGRDNAESIAAVEKQFGAEAFKGGARVAGTAADSCAPWDGAAFAVQLGDMSATAYVSRRTISDALAKGGVVSYPADGKGESGHANIVQCPASDPAKPSNLPCQSRRGVISISNINADSVTGNIDLSDGEHHSLIVFKAKLIENREICG